MKPLYTTFFLPFALACLLLGSRPAAGQFLWQRTVGTAGNDETGEYMIPVAGGFVTVGKSGNQTSLPDQSLYLSKVNYAGDTLWTKRWNFRQVRVLYPQGLIEDRAGNLVVSAVTFPPGTPTPARQGLLIKLTATGDTLWTRTVASAGTYASGLTTLVLGNDGNYVAIGDLASFPALFKYSPAGTLLWTQIVPYDATRQGYLQNLVAVPNGYLVISSPNFGNLRSKYKTVDELGVYQFERPGSIYYPYRLQLDSQGNILATRGDLLKLTPQGDSIWSHSYQQYGVFVGVKRVVELPNGNYLVAGTRYNTHDNDLALVLVDPNGTRLRDTLLVRSPSDENVAGLALTPAGDYVLAGGTSMGTVGGGDQFLFAYRNWARLLPTRVAQPTALAALTAYPNPTVGELMLATADGHSLTGRWVLYDLLGRIVQTDPLPNQPRAHLTLASLPAGFYLLRVSDERNTTQTLRVEKN